MKFEKALEAMKQGAAVKLPTWKGFWKLEDGRIKMHCKDGRILDFCETEDILYTLANVLSEEWEILDDEYMNTVDLSVKTFGFGEALRNLKHGKKVARKGWNGKNQYIQLATGISYKPASGEIVNCDHNDIGNKAIAFIGTSGVQMGWLASQADMLAEDWVLKG